MSTDNVPIKNEIDLEKVDWNNLSIDEFSKIEQKLQTNHKLIKSNSKGNQKRNSGLISVILRGKTYQIKEITYQRLKSMKSPKSKEKLIDEIISQFNPIVEIL